MHLHQILFGFACLINTIHTFGQEGKGIYLDTSEHLIVSEWVHKEMHYTISLPPSYKNSPASSYPVIFLLESDYHLHYASTTVEVMSKEGQIPEMIIVGIPAYDNGKKYFTEDGTLSETDLMIRCNIRMNDKRFLKFLEKELLTEVNKNFRTKNYSLLVGNTQDGLLVTEAYLNNSIFHSYVAINSGFWKEELSTIDAIDTTLTKAIKKKRFYFSGHGEVKSTKNRMLDIRNNQEHLYSLLKNNGVPYSNLKFQIFEEQSNESISLISLYHGLRFVFEDYVLPISSTITMDEVVSHYDTLSDNLGVSFLPPENIVNMIAWTKFNNNDRKEAYKFFDLNISNYPLSHTAYEMLGYAYNNEGKKKEAIKSFEKSLRMNPNSNERIIKLIKDLKANK
ncbi:alpha/beta hydrolase-fold protein [uncultured Aquimarina sp.]|uniref:alpha/beta hydrolase-fold protein n=1 Tax=uncultured Aquimarina sp. TaxID=575652 RepID=UPI002607E129|nr:alpha/beta hydrolase-fold protein [uncultured Aquimarina sp.]